MTSSRESSAPASRDDAEGSAFVGPASNASASFGTFMTGLGFDAHRFAPDGSDRPLRLACLTWTGTGVEADSDGDVAVHALVDALLSAAHLGDIGGLVGVGARSRGAGMSGENLLRICVEELARHGLRPAQASVVIIGNRPHVGPRRAEAEAAMSRAAGCRVSLTATTTDGMGFTGRGEGLAAMATAVVNAGEWPLPSSPEPRTASTA